MMKSGHKVPDGENGRVPVGIDGHDPVDHGKAEGDDHDENKDLGAMLQFLKDILSAHNIFLKREATDDYKHQDP